MKKYVCLEKLPDMNGKGYLYNVIEFDTIGTAYHYFIKNMDRGVEILQAINPEVVVK